MWRRRRGADRIGHPHRWRPTAAGPPSGQACCRPSVPHLPTTSYPHSSLAPRPRPLHRPALRGAVPAGPGRPERQQPGVVCVLRLPWWGVGVGERKAVRLLQGAERGLGAGGCRGQRPVLPVPPGPLTADPRPMGPPRLQTRWLLTPPACARKTPPLSCACAGELNSGRRWSGLGGRRRERQTWGKPTSPPEAAARPCCPSCCPAVSRPALPGTASAAPPARSACLWSARCTGSGSRGSSGGRHAGDTRGGEGHTQELACSAAHALR